MFSHAVILKMIFFGDGKVELSDWWKNYSIQQESREHIFENKKIEMLID